VIHGPYSYAWIMYIGPNMMYDLMQSTRPRIPRSNGSHHGLYVIHGLIGSS